MAYAPLDQHKPGFVDYEHKLKVEQRNTAYSGLDSLVCVGFWYHEKFLTSLRHRRTHEAHPRVVIPSSLPDSPALSSIAWDLANFASVSNVNDESHLLTSSPWSRCGLPSGNEELRGVMEDQKGGTKGQRSTFNRRSDFRPESQSIYPRFAEILVHFAPCIMFACEKCMENSK